MYIKKFISTILIIVFITGCSTNLPKSENNGPIELKREVAEEKAKSACVESSTKKLTCEHIEKLKIFSKEIPRNEAEAISLKKDFSEFVEGLTVLQALEFLDGVKSNLVAYKKLLEERLSEVKNETSIVLKQPEVASAANQVQYAKEDASSWKILAGVSGATVLITPLISTLRELDKTIDARSLGELKAADSASIREILAALKPRKKSPSNLFPYAEPSPRWGKIASRLGFYSVLIAASAGTIYGTIQAFCANSEVEKLTKEFEGKFLRNRNEIMAEIKRSLDIVDSVILTIDTLKLKIYSKLSAASNK